MFLHEHSEQSNQMQSWPGAESPCRGPTLLFFYHARIKHNAVVKQTAALRNENCSEAQLVFLIFYHARIKHNAVIKTKKLRFGTKIVPKRSWLSSYYNHIMCYAYSICSVCDSNQLRFGTIVVPKRSWLSSYYNHTTLHA